MIDDTNILQNLDKKLSAILTFLIEQREEVSDAEKAKTEVVLKKLGFGSAEIAPLVQKNQGAVKKVIQRAKK